MATPSNLYAEKILSEHPLAVWSFDENVDYISLVSESDRNLTGWTKTNVLTATIVTDATAPFPSSYITQIVGNATITNNNPGTTYIHSTSTVTATNNVTISFYIQTTSDSVIYAGFGDGLTKSINSVIWNSGNPKFTVTAGHGYSIGDYVTIGGGSVPGGEDFYSDSGYISSIGFTTTTFTLGRTLSGTNPGTGTGYTAVRGLVKYKQVKASQYPQNSWIPVSFTFSSQECPTTQNVMINFEYNDVGATYKINGLTVGTNSEKTNGESLGTSLITLPTSISTTMTNGVESKNFGTQEYSAYYIGSGSNLYSSNTVMAMSYGSNNSMTVYPNATSGQPSFIFPGFGFLNDIGRYREMTLEAMIRVNVNSSIPQRIIGPIASTDGVYVTNEFISLKIGDNFESYYISEMFRPILLEVQIGQNYANLLIDGETVIYMTFDSSQLTLPSKLDGSNKSQDWIGVYAYSTNVPSVEVDSIALYPYQVPEIVSKRRFVYAQGVKIPENSNSTYNGKTVLIDYLNANYVNNYNYPRFDAKWEQATNVDNFDVKNKSTLSPQTYSPPTSYTTLYSNVELLKDVYTTNVSSGETNSFFTFAPTTVVSGSSRSWSSNTGYMVLNSYSPSINLSNCFYGVFKSLQSTASDQILMKLKNKINNDYLQISLNGTTLSYTFKYQSDSLATLSTQTITTNNIFVTGINLAQLKSVNSKVSDFLSNMNNIDFYIAGDNSLSYSFTGNIYKVGLCTSRNAADITSLFDSNGILSSASTYSLLLSRTATYTVIAKNIYSQITLDIATNSYWENYVSLNKLSKLTYNLDGTQTNSLDFMQFNFDYPEPKNISGSNYDTSKSFIKTYISFQTVVSGANASPSTFTTIASPASNNIIDASTFSSTTKYEIVNNTIIYPPTDVDFTTLAIVLHVEANIDGINTNPVNIRYLQLAAKSLDANKANLLGTKYSVDIYPYIYNSTTQTYDYKSRNPYVIYKESTPYLYLTKYSGIKLVGDYASYTYGSSRGIEINTAENANGIISMQMYVMANLSQFSTTPSKIFSLGGINFYIKSSAGQTKGEIYTDSSIVPIFYINGRKVATPIVNPNEWVSLGISFLTPITNAKFQINSTTLMFNNISYYYANSIEIDQKSSNLSWSNLASNSWSIVIPTQTPTKNGNVITVNTTGSHNLVVGEPLTISGLVPIEYNNNSYSYTVYATPSSTSFSYIDRYASGAITTAGTVLGTWQYISIPNYYQLYSNNIKTIYNIYLGTNKNIIDTSTNSIKFGISNYEYPAYMDAQITTTTFDIV